MNKIKTLLLMTGVIFILAFWLAACDNDKDDKERHHLIEGTWNIIKAEVDATPIANATMTEAQLEAIYGNYTFFSAGTPVTFQKDSISFTASFGELKFPMKLPYTLVDKILTIKAELSPEIMLQIKGDVEFNNDDNFDFDLTQQSYMSILQFISTTGVDENLTNALTQTASADADYNLVRVK